MFSLIIVFILQSPSVHFYSSLLFLWSQLKEEVVSQFDAHYTVAFLTQFINNSTSTYQNDRRSSDISRKAGQPQNVAHLRKLRFLLRVWKRFFAQT